MYWELDPRQVWMDATVFSAFGAIDLGGTPELTGVEAFPGRS